ncbi:MAG: O-antigen ligase family protein, partial [Clostridia bacterium]|nr:O-antigen ligase family protein [Clostridia bacterium]
YNFLAVIVSIVMMIINFRLLIVRGEHTILGGFIWNRLWGVYTDPNHGAVLSAVCILLSLYYFIKVKRRTYRIFNIVNIFLSLTYISSSDSRTGIVALAAGIAVFVYLFAIMKQLTFIKTKWIKCLFCIFISATIAVISIFTVVAQKYAVSETRKLFLSSSNTISQEEIEIGREDDLVDDVSNRRFSIWKSGSELFLKTPIIGTSFRGIVAFAEKVLPNTYLINNNAGKFDCMHNSVFDILVSQGLLGFLAFLSFAITIFVSFFKGLANIKEPGKYLLISSLFAFIILISVSSLFLSEIIYINSIGAVIFWGFLGYAMKFLCVISNEGKIYADNYSNNSRI